VFIGEFNGRSLAAARFPWSLFAMSNSSQLKIGLSAILFASLLIYHAMGIWEPTDADILSLYRLSQIAVVSLFVGFGVWTALIPRLLPSEPFIAGKYVGMSTRNETFNNAPVETTREITFTITQSLFETTVHGTSIVADNQKLHSTWRGTRYDVDGSSHFFGMSIDLEDGSEHGILKLTIVDGNVIGFYWSGDPKVSRRYSVKARKSNLDCAAAGRDDVGAR
jgi:hypothetical protein